MGINYIMSKGDGTKYTPLNLPHGSVCVIIPIQGWFYLRTGLAYQQKGFETHQSISDTTSILSDMTNRQKLHYVSAPLQICYRAPITSRSEYFISAGMDYGFLVKADAKLEINTYENGQFLHNKVLTYHPKVGLIPASTPFKSKEGVQYLLFSPSLRIDACYFWEKQYSLSAFWEYDLTDIRANPETNSIRLACWGLSIGVLLR
jgi:hypothetical protein